MRKRRWGGLLLVAVAVLAAGCGSGTDAEESTTPVAAVRPQSAAPPLLEDLARQLQEAGIPAKATYLVDGKAQVEVQGAEILYYADPSEAEREGEGLTRIAANHPQEAMAATYGQLILWTGGERPLAPAERARFEAISKVVDPQR